MPEQGTHGHVTLLLAEHLAEHDGQPVTVGELRRTVRQLAVEHGGFWSKTAKEPGAEADLVERAVQRLTALGLARRGGGPGEQEEVTGRAALARYAVGEVHVQEAAAGRRGRSPE